MTKGTHRVRTHCGRMDHGGCALLVDVAEGRITGIKGDPDGYLNRGYVCPKGLASAAKLGHPARLIHPLRRRGKRGEGLWEEVSWDAAIAEIGERLAAEKKRFGGRSVAFCQGMPKGLEHFALIRLANLFGSPNVVAVQDVCHAPREVGAGLTCGFYPVTDFHHKSDLIILWGSNIAATNEEGSICSLLTEQLKAGCRLVTVDPKRTAMAERADHWLQVKPGTDGALALAFLNVVIEEELYDRNFVTNWTVGFHRLAHHVKPYTPRWAEEVTWVPAAKIREGAAAYATSERAAIHWGNPIEQHAGNLDTVRALTALMAICGNLDIPGGNIKANEPKILHLGKFVRADRIPEKRKEMIHAHHGTLPGLMTVPPALFKKAVLNEDPYPVTAAYIQCANPVITWAGSRQTVEALKRLSFLAVSDIVMTPTAALADIVLPAATQYEFDDIGHYGLGHGVLLARPKVVEPQGECRPDLWTLNALGHAMTDPADWFSDWRQMLEMVVAPSGLTWKEFVARGYLAGPPRFRKYNEKGFKTPSKKVELWSERAVKFGFPPLPVYNAPAVSTPSTSTAPPGSSLTTAPTSSAGSTGSFTPSEEYPLILTSAKSPWYLHSSYRWVERLREKAPRPVVELHPETAKACGIEENDTVEIKTAHGRITQTAHLTDRIHPGVVHAAYGWWFPEQENDPLFGWQTANMNMLTSAEQVGKAFGTPDLKGIGCAIRKV